MSAPEYWCLTHNARGNASGQCDAKAGILLPCEQKTIQELAAEVKRLRTEKHEQKERFLRRFRELTGVDLPESAI